MSSRYPHTCTIRRPGSDDRTIDEESGQPIGPVSAGSAVYNGPCYYDEQGAAVMREKGGDTDIEGEGVLRLPRRAGVFVQDSDIVNVVYAGVRITARITKTMYLNQTVHLLLTPDTYPVAA